VNEFLAARLPRMPKKERETSAYLSFSVVHHVLHDARGMSQERRAGVLRELQRIMVRYFEPLDERYGAPAGAAGRDGGQRRSRIRRRGPRG
jgi:hypothetical protein